MRMTRRLAITYLGIGEFLREAGVLVVVFGILDHVVRDGGITSLQVGGAFGLGLLLLATGLIFDRATESKDE
jgi:hypothetical protein